MNLNSFQHRIIIFSHLMLLVLHVILHFIFFLLHFFSFYIFSNLSDPLSILKRTCQRVSNKSFFHLSLHCYLWRTSAASNVYAANFQPLPTEDKFFNSIIVDINLLFYELGSGQSRREGVYTN